MSAMSLKAATVVLAAVVLSALGPASATFPSTTFNATFYKYSCPLLYIKVLPILDTFLTIDKSLAPALVRMHFHDCFVQGCDGSVLIYSPLNDAERDGLPNKNSLRGFEVIDALRAAVETICPKIVSCADLLAIAAEYSIQKLQFPPTGYLTELGRRDGNVSLAVLANTNLPPPFFNFFQLAIFFGLKGLSVAQLVLLSSAHTIGSASCGIIQNRLYNFTGGPTETSDPALAPQYLAFLKTKCVKGDVVTRQAMKFNINNTVLDLFTNNGTFDRNYYNQLLAGGGFFTSDDALRTNQTAKDIVIAEINPLTNYYFDFGQAMIAMGRINVTTGKGFIRLNCSSKAMTAVG